MITCIPTGSYATVDIIAAVTLGTMEQLAIVLPRQGIIDTSIVRQTVRTLSIVGNELANFITTHTNDNAIVGTQIKSHLGLSLGSQGDILCRIIKVTGGLQMTHTLIVDIGLDLTEMTTVAQDTCQMAWQRMEGGVEEETTTISTTNRVISVTGCQQHTYQNCQ